MKIKLLIILFCGCFHFSHSQGVVNFQGGGGYSFSKRVDGLNDKNIVKLYPFPDYTLGLGAGYKFSDKLTLLYSVTLNSHGWVVRMREEGSNSYKNDDGTFMLAYRESRYVYQYKFSSLYTIYSKNNVKINMNSSAGFYCSRCKLLRPHWTGITADAYSSTVITQGQPENLLAVFKNEMKNYTFINTFINIGGEVAYAINKSEVGLFADMDFAFGKNFDHRVHFVRGDDWGHIDIRNRGIVLRAGLFYRPYFSLKKSFDDVPPPTPSAPPATP